MGSGTTSLGSPPGRGSPNCGTVREERRPKAGKAFVRAEETVPRSSVTMRAMRAPSALEYFLCKIHLGRYDGILLIFKLGFFLFDDLHFL